MTGHTDRRGKVTVYQYDGINRRKFAGFGYTGSGYESTSTYTFDLGDRITQIVDSIAGTTMRQYDGLDDLTDEQTAQGEVGYLFDNARRRQTMTVVGQPTVSYGWDNANRLTGITQGTTSIPFGYDNANRKSTMTLPNGIPLTYTYDNDSRVTAMTRTLAGNPVGDLEYAYDADGRVIQKPGSFAQTNLPQAVTGNMFNADNEMTAFNGTTLSYDANGNLTNDGTNTYTWDARNHLTAMSGGAMASFIYDALGRRMSKSIAASTTAILYDGFNPVQELDASDTPSANLLTGAQIDEYFQRSDSVGARSYLSDNLGSTLALTDATGAIQTQYAYEPFGNTTTSGASSFNSYQYTGRENDATGLYYYRARYYSPTLQRFIAQDPIGFAGGDANLYGYVRNSPVNLIDPLGMCPDKCPPKYRTFFTHYYLFQEIAQFANTNPDFIAALSWLESTYLTSPGATNENNMFGEDFNSGSQIQPYSNFDASAQDWSNQWASDVDSAPTMDTFLAFLIDANYNTANTSLWAQGVSDSYYEDILKWKKVCLGR